MRLTPLAPAAALALAVMAPSAQAFDIGAMTDAERDAFRAEIRDYLLENPQVLMEAIGVLEAREAEAQAAADADLIAERSDEIFNDGVSWVGGDPEGDVTLVEFMDYKCGYCRKAFEEVETLVETDGNIRFVLKEFPILGEESLIASRFAIATRNVAGDDAYKQVHDALITLRGAVNDDTLERIATDLDLDAGAIMAAMDAPEVREELLANRALAEQLGINGTPGFIIGDEVLRGYLPLTSLQQRVRAAREG